MRALLFAALLVVGCGPISGEYLAPVYYSAISFPGWSNSNTDVSNFFGSGTFTRLTTTYASRKPSGWGGSGGWRDYDFDTPSNVDTQGIVDARLVTWRQRLDFVSYYWFPIDSLLATADKRRESGIASGYLAHKASSHAGDVKRILIIDPVWLSMQTGGAGLDITAATWPYLSTFATWIASEITSPNYFHNANGRSLIGIYDPLTARTTASSTAVANWALFIADLGVQVDVLGYGAPDPTSWTAFNCIGGVAYGVNGAALSPNGQHPWSDEFTKDESIWGFAGFAMAASITPLVDQRPVKTESSAWAERPSAPDFVAAIQYAKDTITPARLKGPSSFITIGEALDELAEGGALEPTVQDGTLWPDLLGHARGTKLLTSLTYRHGVRTPSDYTTTTGTWSVATGVTAGSALAYNGEEERSSTAASTLVYTHPNVTQLVLLGETGPDRGICTVQVDGSTVATVDTYSASALVNQTLYTASGLTRGTHTIGVTISGSHSGSSSGNTVGVEAVAATWVP